jgi:hypothetical protein
MQKARAMAVSLGLDAPEDTFKFDTSVAAAFSDAYIRERCKYLGMNSIFNPKILEVEAQWRIVYRKEGAVNSIVIAGNSKSISEGSTGLEILNMERIK